MEAIAPGYMNETLLLLADFANHSLAATSTTTTTTTTMKPPIDAGLIRFRDDSRFWVQRVLMPIVATVGVFGNAATIYVLTRRGMRSSTNAYLSALAIVDLLYLVCAFWLSLRHYPALKETPFMDNFYSYMFPYSLYLTDAATNTSVWLTVTFTVERYIAVCHPIRGRLLCTESRAKKVIVAVYVACFLAPITTPLEYSVQEVNDTKTNTTRVVVGYSSLGEDETYQTVFYWFTSITFVLLPLALLIIFNSFLIQSVRRSKKLRQAMTQCQAVRSDREERAASNEIRITVTLIAVVMMFLVCQLPTAATLIYKIFKEAEPNTDADTLLLALGNIFNFLVAVNAACNFLLYCALSDKYRRTFVLTFCRCFYRPASPVHSMAFFTNAADQDHGSSSNHSRQASVRAGQNQDRYARHHQSLHAGQQQQQQQQQQRGTNGKRPSSTYLALPDGNGSICRSVDSTGSRDRRSSRSSFQSTSSVRTAVLSNKSKAGGGGGGGRRRWAKWWRPWSTSARSGSSASSSLSSSKRAPNNKPSSILIQISDVEEAGHGEMREMARNGVPDEAVAFV